MTEREQVEKAADRIRDDLMLTLGELDRRREKALDVKAHLRSIAEPLKVAGGIALLLAGAGIGLAIWNSRRHAHPVLDRNQERWNGLKRAWANPEFLARRRQEPPDLGMELGKKLILTFSTALFAAIAHRSVSTLVPSKVESAPTKL